MAAKLVVSDPIVEFRKLRSILPLWLIVITSIDLFCWQLLIYASLGGAFVSAPFGFAVDREERLYLASNYSDHLLLVVEDGVTVGTIPPPTTRGYTFTIENGDTLVFEHGLELVYRPIAFRDEATPAEDFVLEDEEAAQAFSWKHNNNDSFTSVNGIRYEVRKPSGWYRIVRLLPDGEETVVYLWPKSDYICTNLMWQLLLLPLGVAGYLIIRFRKQFFTTSDRFPF